MTEMGTVPRAESRVCVLGRMSLTCALGCQMLRTRACALSPDVRTGAVESEEGRTMAPPLLLTSRGKPQHLGWHSDICSSGCRTGCGREEQGRRRASVHEEASSLPAFPLSLGHLVSLLLLFFH